MVAISALFWAVQVVITASAARYRRPLGFTTLQFAVVAALAGIGATAWEPFELAAVRAAAIDIAVVALFSTALTFTLLTIAMQVHTAGRGSHHRRHRNLVCSGGRPTAAGRAADGVGLAWRAPHSFGEPIGSARASRRSAAPRPLAPGRGWPLPAAVPDVLACRHMG